MEVMLAHRWKDTIDPTGWWISEKLDGIRAIWTGKKLVTRQNKDIYAPQNFLDELPDFAVDGELFTNRDGFQSTSSIVRRKNSIGNWNLITYNIFDAPYLKGDFESRYKMISEWISQHPSLRIKLVAQTKCLGRDDLKEKLEEIISQKGEGLIIRKPHSFYKDGRSWDLLKVKKRYDMEAAVVGYTQGKGKYEGVIGALWVRLNNGKKFKIGTGLTDEERKNPPKIGEIITFEYDTLTRDGIPRDASFKRIRSDL